MSARQYNRKFSLIVGDGAEDELGKGIEFAELRVTFSIHRGDTQTPNSADIRIYNVNAQTANKLENEFTRVIVQAGYEGNFGLIFDGTIKQARSGRVSATDSYVDIVAADGDRLYNFANMKLSLAAGSKPDDALDGFIQSMATAAAAASGKSIEAEAKRLKGYRPELSKNGCVRGMVFYGMARDELREFAEQNDCTWSIQDGKLVLIPLTSFIPSETVLVSPETGLVGVPEQTAGGIRARVLLNPAIRIGQRIKLDSTINAYRFPLGHGVQAENFATSIMGAKFNWDGLYYVMSAEHSGDSRGNDWYTDITCLAVDATVPLDYAPRAAVQTEAASIRRD